MLKEAIDKIESMAQPQKVEKDGHLYFVDAQGSFTEIREMLDFPKLKQLSSLDAMVQMVKTEALSRYAPVYLQIPSHLSVEAFLQTDVSRREVRPTLYEASAVDVPGWEPETKLPFDRAAIALQTRFQDSPDRAYTMQLLSQITTGAHVTYNDTGVATTVVTQKGVSLQQNATIRPLVKLRPYRTFQEIEQPEGLFLIRIDERGISFVEADGGMWKLAARQTVKDYLMGSLSAEIAAGKVIVML
ncbi:MAG: hypothetical protein VB055_06235 [Oscillospiraceae bacterium]|nr:hypothetical protein [Oscillospiraceae bacterium]